LTSTHSPNRQPQQKHLLQNKNISKEISNNSNSNTIIINKLDINHNITTTATTLQIVRPAPLKKLPSLTNTTATITSEGGGGSTATVTTSVVGNIVNNNNKDNHNTHNTKYISPDDSRRNKDEQQKIAAAKKKVALNQRQEQKKQEIKKKQQQCQFPITHQFNIQGYNNNNNRNTTATTMVKNNNDTGEPLQKKQPQAQRNNNNITNNYRVNANTNNTTQQLRTNSIDKIQQDQQISDSTTTTPLFERLQTEEIAELKSYNRILSLKNHQISTFESLLEDLETRLEQETSNRLNLEHLLESSNNTHLKERLSLEKDVDMWKTRVQVEKMKNKKLLEEVNKKDKEIHKMMQRKVSIFFPVFILNLDFKNIFSFFKYKSCYYVVV